MNNTENKEENFNYLITYLGEGNFEARFPDGDSKKCGYNLCGMIRYTYFEDFTIPPVGWSVEREQLMKDYFPKLMKDIQEGKIPNKIDQIKPI